MDYKKYRRWFLSTIMALFVLILFAACLNFVVDPYFHYRKPITKYRLEEERYINDGIARHFDYDSIIIGNSLTENFKTTQYDELFSANSVKLPYSGAGYMELWSALGRALSYNTGVSEVLIGLDMEDMSREAEWIRYTDVPEYLYDNNPFNDLQYLLNKDVLYRGTMYNLMMTIQGRESTTFDDYASWERESGAKNVLKEVGEIRSYSKDYWRTFTDNDRERELGNLETNIVPVIEANPDTLFRMVIPPSSIGKWAVYNNVGEVLYRIDSLELFLDTFLNYGNVQIYAFDDVTSITMNLDDYSDTVHYNAYINDLMLNEIALGNHLLTKDNYKEYLARLREIYEDYDYLSLADLVTD